MTTWHRRKLFQRLHQKITTKPSVGNGILPSEASEENQFWDDYCKLAVKDENSRTTTRSPSFLGRGLTYWPQLTDSEEDAFWKNYLSRSTSFVIIMHGVNIIFLATIIGMLANYEVRAFGERLDYSTSILSSRIRSPGKAILFVDLVIWLLISGLCITTMIILRLIPQGTWSPSAGRDDLLNSIVSALLQTERPPTRGSWIKDITGREIWKAVGNVVLLLRILLLLVRLIGGWNQLVKGTCGYDDWTISNASASEGSAPNSLSSTLRTSNFLLTLCQTCIDVSQVCVFSTVPFPIPWAPLFCIVEVASQIIRLLSCSSILFDSSASTSLTGQALSIIIGVYFVAGASTVVTELSLKNLNRNSIYFENINNEKKRFLDLLCAELKTPLQMAMDSVLVHEHELSGSTGLHRYKHQGGMSYDDLDDQERVLRSSLLGDDGEDRGLVSVRVAVQQLRGQIRIVSLISDNLLFATKSEEGRVKFVATNHQRVDLGGMVGQLLLQHADLLLDKNPLGVNLKHLIIDDESPSLISMVQTLFKKNQPLGAEELSYLLDVLESRLLVHPGRNLLMPGENVLLVEPSLVSILLRDMIYLGLEMLGDLEELCAAVETVARAEEDHPGDPELKKLAAAFKSIARRGPISEVAPRDRRSSEDDLGGQEYYEQLQTSDRNIRSPLLVLGISVKSKEKVRGRFFGFCFGGTQVARQEEDDSDINSSGSYSSSTSQASSERASTKLSTYPAELEVSMQCAPLNRALLLLGLFLEARREPSGCVKSCYNALSACYERLTASCNSLHIPGMMPSAWNTASAATATNHSNRSNSSLNLSQASDDGGPNPSISPPLDLELDAEGSERTGRKYLSIVNSCDALCSRAGGTFTITPSSSGFSIPCSAVMTIPMNSTPTATTAATAAAAVAVATDNPLPRDRDTPPVDDLPTASSPVENSTLHQSPSRLTRGAINSRDSTSSQEVSNRSLNHPGRDDQIKFLGACIISSTGRELSTSVAAMRGLVESLDIDKYDVITFNDSSSRSYAASDSEFKLSLSSASGEGRRGLGKHEDRNHVEVHEVSGGSSDTELMCNGAGLLLSTYDLCFVGSLSRCRRLRRSGYAGRIVLIYGDTIYSDRAVVLDGDVGSYVVSTPFFEVDVELVRRWLLKTEKISCSLLERMAQETYYGEDSAGGRAIRSSLSKKTMKPKKKKANKRCKISPCCGNDSTISRAAQVVYDELSGSLFAYLLGVVYKFFLQLLARCQAFFGDDNTATTERRKHILRSAKFSFSKRTYFGVRRFRRPLVEASFYKWRVTNPTRTYSHHAFILDCVTATQLLVVFLNAIIVNVIPPYLSGNCPDNSCLSKLYDTLVVQLAWFFILFRRSIDRFILQPLGIHLHSLAVLYSLVIILGQLYHTPEYFWDRRSPTESLAVENHDTGKPWILNLPPGDTITTFEIFAKTIFGTNWSGQDLLSSAMLLPAANIILWIVYQPWPYSIIVAFLLTGGSGSIIAIILNYAVRDSSIVNIIFVAHLLFEVTVIMALGQFEYFHRNEYRSIRLLHMGSKFMTGCFETAQKDLKRPLRVILAKKKQILEALADCYIRRSQGYAATAAARMAFADSGGFLSQLTLSSSGHSSRASSWKQLLSSRKQNIYTVNSLSSISFSPRISRLSSCEEDQPSIPLQSDSRQQRRDVVGGEKEQQQQLVANSHREARTRTILPQKLFVLMKALKGFHRSLLLLHELRFELAFKQSMKKSATGPISALPEASSLSRGLLLNRLVVGIASKFNSFDTDLDQPDYAIYDPEDVPIKVFTSIDPRLTIVKADEDAFRCLLVYALRRAAEQIKAAIRVNRKMRRKATAESSRGPTVNGRIVEAVQEIAIRVRPFEDCDRRSFFEQRMMVIEVLDTAFVDDVNWEAKLRAVQKPEEESSTGTKVDKSFAGLVCSDLVDVLVGAYTPRPPVDSEDEPMSGGGSEPSTPREGISPYSGGGIPPILKRTPYREPAITEKVSLRYETHVLQDDDPSFYGYATMQRYCFPFKLDYRSMTAEMLMRKIVPERNKTMRLAQSLIRGDRKAAALGIPVEIQLRSLELSADEDELKLSPRLHSGPEQEQDRPSRASSPPSTTATPRTAVVIEPLSLPSSIGYGRSGWEQYRPRLQPQSDHTSRRISLGGGWHVETVPNIMRARKIMKTTQVDCVFVVGATLLSTDTIFEAQKRGIEDIEVIPLISRSPKEVGIVTALRMIGFDMVIARVQDATGGDEDSEEEDFEEFEGNAMRAAVVANNNRTRRKKRQQRVGDMDVHDFDIVISRLELAMPDAPQFLARVCDKKAVDCLFLREEN